MDTDTDTDTAPNRHYYFVIPHVSRSCIRRSYLVIDKATGRSVGDDYSARQGAEDRAAYLNNKELSHGH